MIDRLDSVLDDIGDFFSNKPESRTYLAVVRYAFPWVNLYVVQPLRNGVNMTTLELVAGSDHNTNAGGVFETYTIGSTVLVCSDSDVHGSMAVTDYIIGPVPVSDNEDRERAMNKVAPSSGVSDLLTKIFDKLRGICGSLYSNVPKSFVQPEDLLSGDINLTSAPYTGVSSLKRLVRIQCGKRCFIELDSLLSRIRIVTEKTEYIGPLKHYQDMSGRGSLLEYNQTALTYTEGTNGIAPGSGGKPAFRKKDIAGDVTTGWQTVVSIPEIATGKSDDVYSSKVRYDGLASVSSAKGFEIKKTLDIVSPYPISDPSGLDSITKEVSDFPELDNNYDKKDAESLMDRTLSVHSGAAKDSNEFPRVAINPDIWEISSNNRTKAVDSAVKEDHSISPIGNRQYYDLPDTIDIKDPHTGKVYKYFKSVSGMRYESDGSIVLYDGYGSEIRMTRGNIIISPASDLIMRPGRDIHTMAGRHTAIVSQKNVILHSSTQDVYIKGNKDVSFLSGINQEGRFMVDDRGETGVLIRSKSNASLAAKDVFVGSIPTSSSNNYIGTTPGSGTVTIGGGAKTLVTGDVLTMYGKTTDIICKHNEDVSWLSIDPSRVITISEKINLSGWVDIGHNTGTLTATIGSTPIGAGNQTSSPHLSVRANAEFGYGINCKQLWAEQAVATRMVASNADRRSGIKGNVSAPTIDVKPPTISQAVSPEFPYSGPWLDTFTIKDGFRYPTSSELGITSDVYTIPCMLWQKHLNGSTVWKEDVISEYTVSTSTCMVYPGKEAWSGEITTGTGTNKPILGGYKING